MNAKHAFSVSLAMMIALTAGELFGSETIQNIPPTPHGAPQDATLEEISMAIEAAAAEQQWVAETVSPGEIRTSILIKQRHRAAVVIGFDQLTFWINYRDSLNLGYSPTDITRVKPGTKILEVTHGPRIHSNYNNWVGDLATHIQSRTRVLIDGQPKTGSTLIAPMIADELEKLDALRVRGVLTQDEFDEQKRKLLDR